jgi:RimJ/RimL family protein N-acetyltransferase
MSFAYLTETIRTPALSLDYHLVPWDREISGRPVAQISAVSISDVHQAVHDFQAFEHWRAEHAIELCACRVPASNMVESMFLEDRGFRFVELNYLPKLTGLQQQPEAETAIKVEPASEEDRDTLADMAGQVFSHGRFHQDPRIDPALGHKRYRTWLINAFQHPQQRVLKCVLDDAIVGFFVVEYPQLAHCFWSLTGLAPGMQGRGLGKRVWRAVLDHHRREGIDTVSTSISSHNVPVFNLYVALGFRFPPPSITLQWRTPGSNVWP